MAHKVELALYDLSRGMAKALSMNFLGKQIDGELHCIFVDSYPSCRIFVVYDTLELEFIEPQVIIETRLTNAVKFCRIESINEDLSRVPRSWV